MSRKFYVIKHRDREKVVYDAEVRKSGGSNYILVPAATGLETGIEVEVTLRIMEEKG